MTADITIWIFLILAILFMLALDLSVFLRKEHFVSYKASLPWTMVWMGLAILFNTLNLK